MKSNIKLNITLNDQRIELDQTKSTLKKSIKINNINRFQRGDKQKPRKLYEINGNDDNSNDGDSNVHDSNDNINDDAFDNASPIPRRNRLPRHNGNDRSMICKNNQDDDNDNDNDGRRRRREKRKYITSAGLGRLSPSLGIEASEMFPPTPSGGDSQNEMLSNESNVSDCIRYDDQLPEEEGNGADDDIKRENI